jgi:hypothetical protein
MYRALASAAQGLLSLRRTHHRKERSGLISSGGKATVALLEPIRSKEQERFDEPRVESSPARHTEEADE